MNQKLQKIIGWILLLIGPLIIFWGLYSSYNIFTGKTPAPEIFKIEEKEIAVPTPAPARRNIPATPAEAQEEIMKIIAGQIKEIIPAQTVISLLNLISWSIFAGLLIFAGGQISAIGIRLLIRSP